MEGAGGGGIKEELLMLKNMKFVTKISVSFGFILILLMLVAYVGYNGMSRVTFRAEKADEVNQMVKLRRRSSS